ncbi:MAG: hypothetical protein RI907_14 [Pseudomonadota bacterium]
MGRSLACARESGVDEADALALSACGGGGGGEPVPAGKVGGNPVENPDVTQPTGIALPAATLSLVPAQAATSQARPGTLAVIDDMASDHPGGEQATTLRRALAIFDTQSKQLLWRQQVSIFGGPNDPITPLGPSLVRSLTLDNVRYAADRRSATYLGAGSLGQPQLVSNRLICYLRPNPLPLQDDGSRALLTVFVPPDKQDCSVSSLAYTSAMMDSGAADRMLSVRELVMPLTDPGGGARGLLTVDRSSRNLSLVVYSMDMSTKLATMATDVASAGTTPVSVLPGQLGDVRWRVLKVGQQIRLLDWRNGRVSLSAPLLTLSTLPGYDTTVADSDGSTVYISDACHLRGIDSSGQLRTVATFAPEAGHVTRILDMGSRLLIDTDGMLHTPAGDCPFGRTDVPSVKRQAVDKATGLMQPVDGGTVFAVANNDIVVLQDQIDTAIFAIKVYSLSSQERVVVAPRLVAASRIVSSQITDGQLKVLKVAMLDEQGKLRVVSLDGEVSAMPGSVAWPMTLADGGAGALLSSTPAYSLPAQMYAGVPWVAATDATMVTFSTPPVYRSVHKTWLLDGTGTNLGVAALPVSATDLP